MSDSSGAPHRTPMTLPGAQFVVEIPEDDVERRLELGWKKVRTRRSGDTGSVPVQRADPR